MMKLLRIVIIILPLIAGSAWGFNGGNGGGGGGGGAPSGPAGGDLGGTYPNPTAIGLHFGATAQPLSSTAPSTNQFLQWNGTNIIGAAGSSNPPTLSITNSATGTITNGLVQVTGAPSTAVKSTAGSTAGVIGICTAGCTTSGTATVQLVGSVSCAFDGATTANHYVQISASTAGDCTDGGASYPASGQVIGIVLATNGSAGTNAITLFDEVQGPFNATNLSAGTVAAARGGAGSVNGLLKANGSGVVSQAVSATDYAPATSGTSILKASSGGFANATAGTDYAAATTGGANTPLFNNGSGGFTNGTRAGNTTTVATTSGTLTSGDCAKFDASGNIIDNGSGCSGAASPFVTAMSSVTAMTNAAGL